MWRITFALLIILAGCAKTAKQSQPPPPTVSQEPSAQRSQPNLVQEKVSLGRCFAATGVGCQSDSGCRPPFLTCQEGSCCSGKLDPETCSCSCAGGPACGAGQWCCEGSSRHVPPLKDVGVLKCRRKTDCLDNSP